MIRHRNGSGSLIYYPLHYDMTTALANLLEPVPLKNCTDFSTRQNS